LKDGSLKIWYFINLIYKRDVNSMDNPQKSFEEHSKEVYSVDWNVQGKHFTKLNQKEKTNLYQVQIYYIKQRKLG
jgi:hypothetical protein